MASVCLANTTKISGTNMDIIVVPGHNRNQRTFNDQFAWCEETFGQFRDRWNYDVMRDVYGFRYESDAVLFKLKWE
jgi:hypothetical protein